MASRLVSILVSIIALGGCLNSAQGQGFTIGNYQVVSSTRVGRTVFEYVLRVTVTNHSADAQGLTAQVFSRTTNTVIIQGNVSFGDVVVGASAQSLDTITIRQDRISSFDPSALQWFFSAKAMALVITIDSPTDGLLTSGTNIVVSGTVGPNVEGVIVGRTNAVLSGTNYSVLLPLEEGKNIITALASNSVGGLGVASVTVTRDTTPPNVSIDTPADGAVLAARQVTVTGLINDVVPGTVNPEQAAVMVNGVAAMVLNRSYSAANTLLVPGQNTITVMATDRAGNRNQRQIQVTFVDPASQKRLVVLGGDAQTGVINTLLPDPLLVELVDADGVAQTNQPVTFAVSRNDGTLFSTPNSGRSLTVLTDDKGQARVQFMLGSRTGVGNNQVGVTSPGVSGQLLFSANGLGAAPAKITPLVPETQVGEMNRPLPQAWTVYVTDAGGNPVEGAPVTFSVTLGDGNFGGLAKVDATTDSDGRASAVQTLGPSEGVNNNQVTAVVPGLADSSAIFTASGQSAQSIENTRVVGVVLDNGNQPMSNILCIIERTTLATATDAQGQFVISNAPVGPIRLLVDARNRGYPGDWHALEFDLVDIAGRDNSVDRPIYMLPLDTDSSALAGGDQDVTLRLKGISGATMTIAAHSLRDANGNPITNRVSWTQVNRERVPMAPPLGSQFSLAWTVQPPGLRFNPPAKVCVPNVSGQPGQVVEMFGYDHDISAFVSIGTATVSSDGSELCSDSGFGVTKSGWGGPVTPPPPCTPVCSGKPADTPCVKYETVPPASKCDCPTYKAHNAKVLTLEGKVNGSDKADVCTNETANFTATATAEYCDSGLSYEWDFGDGSAKVQSSNASHKYDRVGTFTARITAKCTACPSAQKTATVTVNVYAVEIQVNNTAAVNDDFVQIKCDDPIMRSRVHCQARVLGTPSKDVIVLLMNPDGKLRFPADGDATKASTLPKDGTFAAFDISGQAPSAAIGDAVIQAQSTVSGTICGEVKVTVFSFDHAKMDLTPAGSYTVRDTATTRFVENTAGPTVTYAASARIRPAGVDCTIDQVKNLRVSIAQSDDFSRTVIYDTPSINWNAGVAAGTTVTVPATITMTSSSGGAVNDSDAPSDPVYDRGATYLQSPVGCAGAVDATGNDTPGTTAALKLPRVPAVTAAGVAVGTVTYALNRVTKDRSFVDWCVIFDMANSTICALQQRTWTLKLNSAGGAGQAANVGATSSPASTAPLTGPPFANDVANDPARVVTTSAGSTRFTK